MDISQGNPTYTATALSKEEIINNHMSVLSSFGLSMKVEDCDLTVLDTKITQVSIQTTLYHRSCQVFCQAFSIILTSIAVKTGLQKYHNTCFSRSGVNHMWILKHSKDLLETLSSRSQYVCNSIKTFDFSILYTTIPHTLLKSRIKELIQRCFSKKNGEQMYQYLVIGRDKSYFVKSHPKSSNKYKQDEIIQMLDFLIDNIYCSVWGTGVSTNDWYSSGSELFSPLLDDLFSTCL